MAVPYFDYVEEREQLNDLHSKIGEERVSEYWKEKNQFVDSLVESDYLSY